jgi:hypothetical protein
MKLKKRYLRLLKHVEANFKAYQILSDMVKATYKMMRCILIYFCIILFDGSTLDFLNTVSTTI